VAVTAMLYAPVIRTLDIQVFGEFSVKITGICTKPFVTRTHLKNRILVQDRGGVEFKTAGNLLVVEDLKRGTNKDIGPKDIFEMGSIYKAHLPPPSQGVFKIDCKFNPAEVKGMVKP
jgi:hypothetical protein